MSNTDAMLRRTVITALAALMAATLRALPAQRRQRLVLTVASKILAILPDKERTRPYVAQYRDMLTTENRRAGAERD